MEGVIFAFIERIKDLEKQVKELQEIKFCQKPISICKTKEQVSPEFPEYIKVPKRAGFEIKDNPKFNNIRITNSYHSPDKTNFIWSAYIENNQSFSDIFAFFNNNQQEFFHKLIGIAYSEMKCKQEQQQQSEVRNG